MAEHDELPPELRDVAALARDLDFDAPGPSPELRERTLATVRAAPAPEAHRRRRRRRVVRAGGAALAVAAAAAAAIVLATSGGSTTHTLDLQGADGHATAQLRSDRIVLRGDDLRRLRPGEVYELWTVQGSAAAPRLTSAGTFRPSATGTVDLTLRRPPGTSDKAQLAITVEADADPAPTLPPVLRSS
jgi:hypothetical protein